MKKLLYCFFRYPSLRINFSWMLFLVLTCEKTLAQSDTTQSLTEVNIKAFTTQLPLAIPAQMATRSDFIKNSSYNVADAIRNFAGVNVRDYGGIGGLKTVSVRSLGANHTLVLYDGIKIFDAQTGQIDLSKFNLYNIQSIALYIPQQSSARCIPASNYTSSSVLSIQTVRPVLSPEKPYQILAGVKGGSFGLVQPYLQWQQRISDKWLYVINSYYQHANGRYSYLDERDGSDTLVKRSNSDVRTHQIDGSLYWTHSDSNRLSIQFNYYNTERGLPGTSTYNKFSRSRLYNEDYFLQGQYRYLAASSFELLLSAKASQSYVHYIDPDYPQAGGLAYSYKQHDYYQSASAGFNISPSLHIGYSSEVIVNTLTSDIRKYAFPTRLSLLNAIAATLNAGKWSFEGNLLHTYIKDEVKTGQSAAAIGVFSPAFIVSYVPSGNKDIRFRAFYKDIFRYSTFGEQYYYAITYRDIEPEKIRQVNAGVIYSKAFTNSLFDYIKFSADGYYNRVHNKIIYLLNIDPSKATVTNIGEVEIKGIDATVKTSAKLGGKTRATLNINYTYQHAVDVTNPEDGVYKNQIPYTPRHSLAFNIGGNYKRWGVFFNQSLSGSRYFSRNNQPAYYLQGYAVSDLSASYDFSINKLPALVSAECSNLFNENYEVVSSYYMPRRSLRLTFQITI